MSSSVTPGRFLRRFAALHVIEETAVDEWKATSFSLAMGDESTYTSQLLRSGFNQGNLCGINLHSFLASTTTTPTRSDPYSSTNYLQENHTAGSDFVGMMTGLRNHKMDWTEVYNTVGIVEGADLTGPAPLSSTSAVLTD